ncbi:MAG: glycosyltransferase family 39 protein [Oscillospiraceae bacterium]|nr:glycosyltransferase family 39 protein [Oscillospiraceae bacterium]
MLKCAYQNLIRRHEWFPVALLLLLGCVLRLAALGSLPYGLNQDEASAGYEAFALLTEGVDRNGDSWPVLLTAWGSGQNALLSYLAIPFVALLGPCALALRLPLALSGCLMLPVFWLLARRTRGRFFGVTALFFLALNPWHIMMSRWGLESNLLPFFLCVGVYLTACAPEHPWAVPGAAAAFGLSLYAYGTAFFFLPLYLIAAVLWLRQRVPAKQFCLVLLLFLLLALPISVCQLRNALGLDALTVFGVTLPRLTESRQAATSVFGGGSAAENFRTFLCILWTQSDGLSYNSPGIWRGGIFYCFGLPLAAVGFVASLLRRRDVPWEMPMRTALLCALVCAALVRGNINRLNMIWLPLVYFSALGAHLILMRLGSWAVCGVAGALVCFLLFFSSYSRTFGGAGNVNYFPGLGEAVQYAEGLDAETVYITNQVNAPYIFALFYAQVPPTVFAESVEYTNPDGAFRAVERFAGYEFVMPEDCDVLILHWSEAADYTVLASFGSYCVCAGGAA